MRTTTICTLPPSLSNNNTHIHRTSRFRLVVTHGMHILPSDQTFNSKSYLGPERANRTITPLLPLYFSTYVPFKPSLPHYVLLLSGFTAKSMLYLAPCPHLCCLISFRIPSSSLHLRGLLEQISFVLSCYLDLRYPLHPLTRMVSLQLLSCFFTSSLDSNVLFPQIDLLSKFAPP